MSSPLPRLGKDRGDAEAARRAIACELPEGWHMVIVTGVLLVCAPIVPAVGDSLTLAAQGAAVLPRQLVFDLVNGGARAHVGADSIDVFAPCACNNQTADPRCVCLNGALEGEESKPRSNAAWSHVYGVWKEVLKQFAGSEPCLGVYCPGLVDAQREDEEIARGRKWRRVTRFRDDGTEAVGYASCGQCALFVLADQGVGRKAHWTTEAEVDELGQKRKRLICDECFRERGNVGKAAQKATAANPAVPKPKAPKAKLTSKQQAAQAEARADRAEAAKAELEAQVRRERKAQRSAEDKMRAAPDLGEHLQVFMSGLKNTLDGSTLDELEKLGVDRDDYVSLRAVEQLAHSQLKKHNSLSRMTWTPQTLKKAYALYKKTPATFRAIKDSGLVALPSETLLDELFTRTDFSGHGQANWERVKEETKHLAGQGKYVVMNRDEVKVKAGLVMRRKKGGGWVLIGFTDSADAGADDDNIISTALVYTVTPTAFTAEKKVRGNMAPCTQTFDVAAYGLTTATSDVIGEKDDEVMTDLYSRCGLTVVAVSADGAATNRTVHRYRLDGRKAGTKGAYEFAHGYVRHPVRRDLDVMYLSDPTHSEKKAVSQIFSSWLNPLKKKKKTKKPRVHRKMVHDAFAIVWDQVRAMHEWQSMQEEKFYRYITEEVVRRSNLAAMRVFISRALLDRDIVAKLEVQRAKGAAHAQGSQGLCWYLATMLDILEPMRGGAFTPDDVRFVTMRAGLDELRKWHDSFASPAEREAGFISAQLHYDLQSLVVGFEDLVSNLKVLAEIDGFAFEPVPPQCVAQDQTESLFGQYRATRQGGGLDWNDLLHARTAVPAGAALVGKKTAKSFNQPTADT